MTNCIQANGYIQKSGYALSTKLINGKRPLAHRVAYENRFSHIPKGMNIDHLCRNRSCINTDHMEVVTPTENKLRGVGITAVNARKTHCKKGHIFDSKNTYRYLGSRVCRTCSRLRYRIWDKKVERSKWRKR